MMMFMRLRKTAINKLIVEAVIERAQGYCEVCGRPASSQMALHHRKLRSRGGKDTVANLIWVHHKCHNLGTKSIHLNPEYAEQKGWICPSWLEPENYPFVQPDGAVVLLQDNGDKVTLLEGE